MENKRRLGVSQIIALACAGVFVVCAALVGVFVGVNAGHRSVEAATVAHNSAMMRRYANNIIGEWNFTQPLVLLLTGRDNVHVVSHSRRPATSGMFHVHGITFHTLTNLRGVADVRLSVSPHTQHVTWSFTYSLHSDFASWAAFSSRISFERGGRENTPSVAQERVRFCIGFSDGWYWLRDGRLAERLRPWGDNPASTVDPINMWRARIFSHPVPNFANHFVRPHYVFTRGDLYRTTSPQPPPPTGQQITGNTLAWESVDNAASYRVYVNNVRRHTATANPDFYTFDLASLNLPVGTHQVRVVTVDSAGFTRTPWGTMPFVVNGVTMMVGGIETQIPVADGLTLSAAGLPIPTEPEGYMFVGWGLEGGNAPLSAESVLVPLSWGTVLTSDMVLVPIFAEIPDEDDFVFIDPDYPNGDGNGGNGGVYDPIVDSDDDGSPIPTWAIGLVGGIGGVALIGAAVAVFFMVSKKRERTQ